MLPARRGFGSRNRNAHRGKRRNHTDSFLLRSWRSPSELIEVRAQSTGRSPGRLERSGYFETSIKDGGIPIMRRLVRARWAESAKPAACAAADSDAPFIRCSQTLTNRRQSM